MTTSYTYDLSSNVLSKTVTPKTGSPLSPLVTTYGYDPLFNKPTRIVDPRGLVSIASYDIITGNLKTSIADAGAAPHLNALTGFTYNSVGQPLSVTDPLGVVAKSAYDGLGNLTSIVRDAGDSSHLNQTTSMNYSAVGDVISVTDPRGNVTTSVYDLARHVLNTTSPASEAARGSLLTAFSYDPAGRLTQTQQSIGGQVLRTTRSTYTVSGKPAAVTDANGHTTIFTYDALDRVSTVTDPMQRVTRIVYDALGRRSQVLNAAIQSTPLLQLVYTPDGPLGSLTDANNHTTTFTYDGFDRLATTTYPLGSTETLTYDNDNNVLMRKTRANQTITFAYDTLNRLITKTPLAPTPVVSYGYDLANRLIGVSDTSAAITVPTGASASYATNIAYDQTNRQVSITWNPAPGQATPTAASAIFTHGYDASNRRVSQSASDNSWWTYPTAASSVSYTANNLNQYTAVGAVTPGYDSNGNLTSDGTFTFGYDAENRLVSASGAGNAATYSYDAQGRRKSKTVNGAKTVYVTDADNREVLEYDGTSGAVKNWYSYALGPNDVLNQMAVAATTRATFIPDIQGSIVGALDASSGALTKTGYRPYGESTSTTGSFRYTGQRIDPETNGLYYYRARHYMPAWGRFMQSDPIGYSGGSNLYSYVNNDPLNATDPSGLFGFILSVGGQAEAGLSPFGQAGGQASQNFAFLVDTSHWSSSNPLNINFSVVSYQSYGGTASVGLPQAPQGPVSNPLAGIANQGGGVIVGAFAGGGVSAGVTNANTAADFAPNSATVSANVGLLGTELGGQISKTASGTWTATANIPGLGAGAGVAASIYQTQSSVQTLFTTAPSK